MENNPRAPKRRGRPAGSKNKRSRVTVTNPSENVLAVPAGGDVIAAVYDYANRHQLRGLGVVTAQGTVKTVTLYQPNTPFFLTCNDTDYRLLYFMGNFYGPLSSIKPFAAFVNEGNLHTGIVQGELVAKSDMVLGFSYINETESIKLKLPPLPPQPRALPPPPLFLDPYARFRPATNRLLEFSSGGGRFRAAYGVPAAPSPSPLIACLMTNGNNTSSTFGQRSSTALLGGRAFIKRENY